MIERIKFNNVNLKAFADVSDAGASSEVWGSVVEFLKGKSYLVEAGSGRGKSSFCTFLYALRSDYTGQITVVDSDRGELPLQECDAVSLRRTSLSIMFQDLRLFPELSSVDNVLLNNQLTGYTNEDEVRSMLTRLGLGEKLDTPCGQLSFGQQQRVAFVRSLCQPFDFILLDEPISHLDGHNAAIMAEMLRERQQKDGVGVIVTSIGYRLPYEYDYVYNL